MKIMIKIKHLLTRIAKAVELTLAYENSVVVGWQSP
jgi:hypothetical protein